ncbi:MAG TPA: 3-carboxy-cis,cis-muconate cycloisomerase [Conexibacter sp.]|nr:3-carboxy-cis,cis-muconate cycloisomerase [Conexibacter sp.]
MRFARLFVPDALVEAVGERAWLQAALDFEGALALVEAEVGLIPPDAAEAIAACCAAARFDGDALVRDGRAVGNPAEPLVRALRSAVGQHGVHVHHGATSQDAMDTAAALVVTRALVPLRAELAGAADACATLAQAHRDTPMAARTLLQQALPTTFGAKAAGWLEGLTRTRRALERLPDDALAVQLGGGAGTLAALGERGPAVVAALAARLGLAEPALPWHAERGRVVEVAAALALGCAAAAKIARDVALLAQSEVAEVTEGAPGGSSAMPHKRNPTGCVLAAACAQRGGAHAAALVAAPAHEHERAIGAWHAEWDALSELLACCGGALAHVHGVLAGLRVDDERMRVNLEALLDALPAPPGAPARRDEDELRRVVGPECLGSVGLFVDRALAAHGA